SVPEARVPSPICGPPPSLPASQSRHQNPENLPDTSGLDLSSQQTPRPLPWLPVPPRPRQKPEPALFCHCHAEADRSREPFDPIAWDQHQAALRRSQIDPTLSEEIFLTSRRPHEDCRSLPDLPVAPLRDNVCFDFFACWFAVLSPRSLKRNTGLLPKY